LISTGVNEVRTPTVADELAVPPAPVQVTVKVVGPVIELVV
jgi:hypothetical protein